MSWGTWHPDPAVIVALVTAAWAYGRGVRRVLWRDGRVRGVRRSNVAAFGLGLAAVAAALLSPIAAMAEALLWVHMLQHVLLVMVAAPLLVLGRPGVAVPLALPPRWRRSVRRWGRWGPLPAARRALVHPASAWGLSAAALWTWHLPALYEGALRSGWVHVAEHGTLLGTGVLFWWVALGPHRRLARGADVLFVVTGGFQGATLGALFTFAGVSFYPSYRQSAAAWGLSPLADQQLAGVIMWIPAGVVYLAAASALFVAWLRAAEAEAGPAPRAPSRGGAMVEAGSSGGRGA